MFGGVATVFATARSYTVPSPSMENTVQPGDRVLVDLTAQVHRGDVIIGQQTSIAPGYFIRRVIGLPGDHVACCDARGRITVNGKPLDETYVAPGDAPSLTPFSVTVPAGRFWLLGDFRSIARDSRTEGPLAIRITGRVFVILRPGHAILLRTPRTFIADGLAPASSATPPALIGVGVFGLAIVLLVVLAIFGTISYTVRMRRRSRQPAPLSVSVGHTWDEAQS